MESGNKMVAAIVALVIGVVVGGLGGYYAAGMKDMSSNDAMMSASEDNPNTATKAADLRVTLNQIMRQHVELSTIALVDVATKSPATDAASKALDNNSVELADAVGSVYGDEARTSFLSLWREHIGFFVAYTQAKVKGDDKGMKDAKDGIANYTEEASTFFANANPNIDKDAMKDGLMKHGNQVFAIVDAYAAKDYTKAFELEEEAYNHIGMAADGLSAAIVKQFPDKF